MTDAPAVARARLLIATRRYSDVVAILAAHLAEAPDDEAALCLIAQARLQLHQPGPALEAAQAALRLAPQDEWGLRLASIALMRLGHDEQARAMADGAVRSAPNLWLTHVQRAQVDATAKTITPVSWQAARRAVELAPLESSAHQVLGLVALAAKKNDVAEASFRAALRLDPDDAEAQNNLGVVLLRRRRVGRALSTMIGAARADPSSVTYRGNIRIAFCAWFTYLALAGVLLTRIAYAATEPAQPGRHPTPVTVCAIVIAAAAGLVWWRVARASGVVFRGYLSACIRRDGVIRAVVLAPLGAVACMAVAAAVGTPTAAGWLLAATAFDVLAVAVGVLAFRVQRRRR